MPDDGDSLKKPQGQADQIGMNEDDERAAKKKLDEAGEPQRDRLGTRTVPVEKQPQPNRRTGHGARPGPRPPSRPTAPTRRLPPRSTRSPHRPRAGRREPRQRI